MNDAHSEPEDPDESENDNGEESQEGCSWQSASSSEKDEQEEEPDEISGDPLSLRGTEFDAIIVTADAVLNRLVSMLHQKKQRDGEMTVKVTFEDVDGDGSYVFSGAVSGKINYTVKPQKIVGDAVELRFDPQGNPVVPYDREHQLSFDEVPPAAPVVTQVDGGTGLVEKVTVQEEEQLEPEPDKDDQDDQGENNYPDELYPCKYSDCPFFGSAGDIKGCGGALMTHYLKILPEYFGAIRCGVKTFELRRNDRNYQPGDTLVLQEWTLEGGYTGRELTRYVPYVLCGPALGLDPDWCILSLQRVEEQL